MRQASRSKTIFGTLSGPRKRAQRRGATLFELALVLLVFFTLLVGIIEIGVANWRKGMVSAAARVGSRYAIVRGAQSGRVTDNAGVQTYVQSKTTLSPITVVTTWPTTKEPGQFVEVQVQYTHYLMSGVLQGILPSSVVLTGRSRMVIVF